MAVEVLIRRKIKEGNADQVSPLIVKLRSLATIQPGYISGETLNCIDPPGKNEYLVISTWQSVEDWKKWFHSTDRKALDDQIEQLTRQKSEYAIYEPLVGGIIPAAPVQEVT